MTQEMSPVNSFFICMFSTIICIILTRQELKKNYVVGLFLLFFVVDFVDLSLINSCQARSPFWEILTNIFQFKQR